MGYGSIGLGGPKRAAIRTFAVVTFAFASLLLAAPAAKAQLVCMQHQDFRAELHRNFQEVPAATAIANNGALIVLYAKHDQSSWTLVMTRPGGLSCVLVAGQEWSDLQMPVDERIAARDPLTHRREIE